ncbi:putative membrane protein [Bacteroides fragilis str. 3725 D9(v)]|nr:putative membrane protein [Bacteroides fragilis str. 3986 N(B)19]EXZ22621.1 putative membrane protein [Bacteroides fragilis str. S13 L11]EXZ61338.1 putative membrane protein [Bacteroides fragilis str. 3725 D9(v)]EXZ66111.1 putative membrane protein [Bacteroides fragilis str. 3783N1-8]EXZ98556.1 putative membrane protein [Bacteroides fragilis str. S23 R14]EYA07370.1 putative membrane protein [Bacteroides fragilis str. S6R6]EYA31650.1 putative membrane protein [Bacteroides fragilis str. 1009
MCQYANVSIKVHWLWHFIISIFSYWHIGISQSAHYLVN